MTSRPASCGKSQRSAAAAWRAALGSMSSRSRWRPPKPICPPRPAERDPAVLRRAEVVEQRAAVVDVLAARPADLLDHVGHRLADHHVARGDRERVPEAVEPGGGAVHGQHRRVGAHRSLAGRRARRRADSFRTAVRSWSRTPASITFARRPSARSAGCTFAAVGRSRPPRKAGEAQRAATSSCDSGCASSGAPTAAHASTSSSQSPSCAVARRDLERAAGPVARVDALLGAERADPVHGALGGAAYLDRAGVADAVAQDRQVVPERRDEAAVASARPVPREAGLEHDDVEPGLERLQLPRRPEAEVAAADDDHVCRRVALERPGGLDRPRLLEPVAVARVPHGRDPTRTAASRQRIPEPELSVACDQGTGAVRSCGTVGSRLQGFCVRAMNPR